MARFDPNMLRRDTRKLAAAVREIILENPPSMSINDLSRKCLDEGVPVTKPLVRDVRAQLKHITEKSREAAATATIKDIRKMDPGAPLTQRAADAMFDQHWDRELEERLLALPVPKSLEEQERYARQKAEMEAERDRKKKAQEEREAKWAARAAEKEAEWKAKEEEEKRRDAEELAALEREYAAKAAEQGAAVSDAEREYTGLHLRWDVTEEKGLGFWKDGKLEKYLRLECQHRRSYWKAGGACPGCFARVFFALKMIQKEPAKARRICEEVFERMQAENAAARLKGFNGPEPDEDGVILSSKPLHRPRKKKEPAT